MRLISSYLCNVQVNNNKHNRTNVSTSLSFFLQDVTCDAPLLDTSASALPLEHRAVYGAPPPLSGPSANYGPPHPSGGGGGGLPPGPDDPWPLASPDQPQIKHLQVQCEKTHMRVNIEFDRPFYGMIFSKGKG